MGRKVVKPPPPVENTFKDIDGNKIKRVTFNPILNRLSSDASIIHNETTHSSTQGDKKCESRLQSIKLYSDSLSQNINFINGCITSYTDILKHK